MAEYVIIRPGVVFGTGSRYFGNLVAAVDRFGPLGFPSIGKGNNVAPLIHVQDLSQAIYLAGIMKDAIGQTFNLTDGLTHSWYDFFNTIAISLGKKFRLLPVPTVALSVPSKIIDFIGDVFHVKFSLNTYVQFATCNLLFLNGKVRRLLGWHPEYTLERGVEDLVRAYQMKER